MAASVRFMPRPPVKMCLTVALSPQACTLLDSPAHACTPIWQVSGGPLPVRLACPSRPAISGRTVPQRYFCTPTYVEVDMDVSKDAIASRALSIAKPASKVRCNGM